ncbi:MAG: UbiA prenyltransferase family protein [Phycisphaerales bacterium]
MIRLARPGQWVKGAFVLVGPLYGGALSNRAQAAAAGLAFLAFGLASSACYIFNDLRDVEADRLHPRKKNRPIASGRVKPGVAMALAFACAVAAAATVAAVGLTGESTARAASLWLGTAVGVYAINVLLYSILTKNIIILDVIALALGFVLRVLGGCAAVAVEPSSWLLNVTFFIAMFLAFGKRLGERRVMGEAAVSQVRDVQTKYTEDLLRMMVVVTGVATLLTYAGYVLAQSARYTHGFNLLWLTMLPATYALLRCIVLLEKGTFDDPTELATKDRAFQAAALVFVLLTVGLMVRYPAGV